MWLAIVAGAFALASAYWDDVWHTEKGRDTLLSPPHILLYGAVAVLGGVVAWWIWQAVRIDGVGRLRKDRPGLVLGAVGVVALFGSAPVDEIWHSVFGRDAVLWSPPHLLSVVATLSIGVVVLIEAATRFKGHRWLHVCSASLVIGAASIPVMEYETDVAQFDWALYLPALAASTAFAFGVVALVVGEDRWMLTRAAAVLLGVRLAIAAALIGAGFSPPLVPGLLVAAVLADHLRRRYGFLVAGLGTGVGISVGYTLALWGTGWAPELIADPTVLAGSAVGAGLVAAMVFAFVGGRKALDSPGRRTAVVSPRSPIVVVAAVVLAATLLAPDPADAHDPGQGDEVVDAQLRAMSVGDTTAMEIEVEDQEMAAELDPIAGVARRAGATFDVPLVEIRPGVWSADFDLPEDGQWFLYGTFGWGNEVLETWMTSPPGSEAPSIVSRSLYIAAAPSDSAALGQAAAGVVLYGLAALLLVVVVRQARESGIDEPIGAAVVH